MHSIADLQIIITVIVISVALINAEIYDIMNQLRSLFNAQL